MFWLISSEGAMLEGILPQINTPVTLLGMVLVLFLLYLMSSTSGPDKEPPGPRPLPLLGNLLTLDLKRLQVSLCELYNIFPWLNWCCGQLLMNRTKLLKNIEKNINEIKGLVQGLRDTLNPQDLRGFVDSFLLRQQEESDQLGSSFHNNNLFCTVANLFAAGTDTTGTILRWGLLLMAKYPHIQVRLGAGQRRM